MNAYKNVSFVGFVIFFFGIVLMVYGFSFLTAQNELEDNGVRVKGTVIELVNNGPMYVSPMVKFTTQEGEERMFKSEMDLNKDLNPYSIGQEVDVIYHKDNPSNAKIDAFLEANFAQIFLGCFGIFLMLLGLFIRRHFLKKAAQYN